MTKQKEIPKEEFKGRKHKGMLFTEKAIWKENGVFEAADAIEAYTRKR